MHVGHLPGFGSYGMVRDFRECFGKSLYGRNLLLVIQDLFLLPQDIRFSTNEGLNLPAGWCTANIYKGSRSLCVLMCVCVCVGKCLLTSCERVIQKKTLNPFFYVNTIRLDALLQYNNSFLQNINK